MLHRISGKKLGRTSNQRKALFNGLAKSLFTYGSIETTNAKAKAVIPLVERLANKAIKGDLNAHRQLFVVFQDRHFVGAVVAKMKEVFGTQTSNFTVVKKVKHRQGDDALIVKLSLVKPYSLDLSKKAEVKTEEKATKAPKKAPKATVKKVKKTTDKE